VFGEPSRNIDPQGNEVLAKMDLPPATEITMTAEDIGVDGEVMGEDVDDAAA